MTLSMSSLLPWWSRDTGSNLMNVAVSEVWLTLFTPKANKGPSIGINSDHHILLSNKGCFISLVLFSKIFDFFSILLIFLWFVQCSCIWKWYLYRNSKILLALDGSTCKCKAFHKRPLLNTFRTAIPCLYWLLQRCIWQYSPLWWCPKE